MSEIDQIKKNISIFDLASQFNANPNKNGKCKYNPLRIEKSCSLQLYSKTNTFNDFGGVGGDVIKFYELAKNCDTKTAIADLKQMGNVVSNQDYQIVTVAPIPQKEYMQQSIVRKIFDRQFELDYKEHKELLTDILPWWVYQEATKEDTEQFQNIMRKSEQENTLVVLLKDEHNVEKSMRYRYKMIGEELKKWVALSGTESNFLYTRLTENPITLVTEGTSCYLTALLLGYSVISLPSSGYKGQISKELTDGRILIFIGDNDESGIKAMDRISDDTICDKKRFNFDDYKTKGTDFKSIVEQHKSIDSFKKKFDKYIDSLDLLGVENWNDILNKSDKAVTRQIIEDAVNAKFLIEDVLASNMITLFVGVPNVGKTAVVFAMAKELLNRGKISNLLYFDADNPLVYTKDRILTMFDDYGEDRVKYYSGATSSIEEMIEVLTTLSMFKTGGENVLIVIDSLQNFINGSVNDDVVIKKLFELLQRVRDNFGATIIVLHHTRKGKDEDGKLNYVGSQRIKTSCDTLTYISKDEVTKDMLFNNDKARSLIPPKKAFKLDFDKMTLEGAEYPEEVDTKEADTKALLEFLKEHKDGYEKNKIANKLNIKSKNLKDIIAKHNKEKWVQYQKKGIWMIKIKEENLYSKEPIVTVFEADDIVGF